MVLGTKKLVQLQIKVINLFASSTIITLFIFTLPVGIGVSLGKGQKHLPWAGGEEKWERINFEVDLRELKVFAFTEVGGNGVYWVSEAKMGLDVRRKVEGFRTRAKEHRLGTSLVAQWLRIRLPLQGTRARSLVQEDSTCHGATKPVSHNYWACALEPVSHNYWAHEPQLLKLTCLEPILHIKRSHCNEKPAHRNEE